MPVTGFDPHDDETAVFLDDRHAYHLVYWPHTVSPSSDGDVPAGITEMHQRADGQWCAGYVPFDRHDQPGECWTVESDDPLTLSPSLLCRECQEHGWIREGKWVPA